MFLPTISNIKSSDWNKGRAQVIGIFFIQFLNFPIFVLWYQFIVVQVTFQTQYYWAPLKSMLDYKHLHQNNLNTVTLWKLNVCLGGQIMWHKKKDYL